MGEAKLNRLARRFFSNASIQEDFIAFGEVTHAEAAELCARKFNHIGMIETKDCDGEKSFFHEVEPRTVYSVKSLRGDS